MSKLNSVEPPKDERPSGEVIFNYASYDGRFVIGAERWAFETSWSGAGQGSAHLYNDPAGIDGVAIAEGIASIGHVTPDVIAAADFTSRTRTPRVGQVALLRNTAGFYAALEPLQIGYSAAPSGNVIRLRFAIQTDGSTDFSSFASALDDRQALTNQLITAAADAERALKAVLTGESIDGANVVGIGHNQPPPEFAITEADRAETLAAIDAVREEAVSAMPSTSRLRAAGQLIARVIAGSNLWTVRAEPQRAASDAIAESIENSVSEAAFDERRRAVLAILGFDPDTPTVTGGYDGDRGVAGVFARLLPLPDAAVRDVLAVVMAETIEAGSAVAELLGSLLGVDMAKVWKPDDALLDLIRDREVLGAVLSEVAGESAAIANEAATGKIKRQIIRDCLTGDNGRAKVEGWIPRWMAFPPSSYTERDGVGTVNRAEQIAGIASSLTSVAQPLRIAA